MATPSRNRRRAAVACAVAVLGIGGCQAILGIDPDARHEADASSEDVATTDVARDVAADASGKDAATSDGSIECEDAGDCVAIARSACEKGICADGHCALVSRDGETCDESGTCRGYACVSANLALAASGATTCARTFDGLVWCWGNDANGQLADRLSAPRSTPYLVPHVGDDLAGATAIDVGPDHACAVLTDKTIACWGANGFGQSTGADAGGATASVGPVLVHDAPLSKAIAAGFGSTCALGDTGDVWCWGDNSSGQLGLGSSASVISQPRRIDLLTQVEALSGSWKTVCVSRGQLLGDFSCWGDNTWGQLGPDFSGPQSDHPVGNSGLGDDSGVGEAVGDIRTSWGNVCVRLIPGGTLECWGNDRAGQLGNGRGSVPFGDGGSGDVAFSSPDFVASPDGGADPLLGSLIVGTGTHFCTMEDSTRNFYCWGENSNGELGALPGFYPQPFHAVVFDGALAIALGDEHACMLHVIGPTYHLSCLGRAELGQTGDGFSITDHMQTTPIDVNFPSAPGGVAALRASE